MTDTVRPVDQHPTAEQPESPPQPEPPRPARRRESATVLAVVAVAIVVVFAGSAAVYSLLQPTVYGAQAEFLLTIRPDISDAAADRAMVTQVMIVESPAVLQPVADSRDTPLARLERDVSAEMIGRSNILRITVADRDRARSLDTAELIAAAYSREAVRAGTEIDPPLVRSTVLTPARSLDQPLQPRPWRALAAGTLLGLLAAGVVVAALWRPWRMFRPAPYWT
jgi:uncharacterized protein involved in exopolysaccharide biosynthesis